MRTCQLQKSSAEIVLDKFHKYIGGGEGVMFEMAIVHVRQSDLA